jgi:uncharacterized protein with FMN-binding domain
MMLTRRATAIGTAMVLGLGALAGAALSRGRTQAPPDAPPPTPTAVAQAQGSSSSGGTQPIAGPSVDMQWGPVQVTIIVKGKKVTDVQATAPMERARSNYINSQALPWLRQETLQAQSANIDVIGGATLTSEAYAGSLQAALAAAHH